MSKHNKLVFFPGLFLLVLLLFGCESKMAMEARMEEIAGDYVLEQPDAQHPIPQDEYEAVKTAHIWKSGDEWVMDYICPVISFSGGRYSYSYHRICQNVYFNQVLGEYLFSSLSMADYAGTGLRSIDLEPIHIESKTLVVGKFRWNKQ